MQWKYEGHFYYNQKIKDIKGERNKIEKQKECENSRKNKISDLGPN